MGCSGWGPLAQAGPAPATPAPAPQLSSNGSSKWLALCLGWEELLQAPWTAHHGHGGLCQEWGAATPAPAVQPKALQVPQLQHRHQRHQEHHGSSTQPAPVPYSATQYAFVGKE